MSINQIITIFGYKLKVNIYTQKTQPNRRVDILASKKSLFTVTEYKVYIQLELVLGSELELELD